MSERHIMAVEPGWVDSDPLQMDSPVRVLRYADGTRRIEHVRQDRSIDRWRRAQSLHRTLRYRPDLVEAAGGLGELDRRLLEEFPPVTYP